MISKAKLLAAALALAVPLSACESRDDKVERWATTENTNVQIDWDKVNQAYRDASGPEDLEKRINEIYEGDEVISIAVADQDDKTQVVTGFFDKNSNGSVEDDEKIFTIKREPTGEGKAQVQTVGYGPYAGYHSPVWDIAMGMVMGSMISNMFMPSYVPYRYVTHPTRIGGLHAERASYRQANPAKFGPRSQSGRRYGGGTVTKPTSRWGTGRPSGGGGGYRSGGGRFGLARAGRTTRVSA
jgi:hypothetical protein